MIPCFESFVNDGTCQGCGGKFSAVRKEIQWHESLAVAVRRKGRCTLYDNRLYLVVQVLPQCRHHPGKKEFSLVAPL